MSDGTVLSTPPDIAAELFGTAMPAAQRYAEALADDGVVRGMIGPREVERLWERHLLNCAVLSEVVPRDATVIDVGSGAGLPGIPLAIARPDLAVTLLEPMQRRTDWLGSIVAELELPITVIRGRAEERAVRDTLRRADVVTSRAVAPLDRLAAWSLPLAKQGGEVLALKGASASAEVDQHRDAITRIGGGRPTVLSCGQGWLEPPARVVRIERVGSARQRGQQRNRTRRSR